MLDATPLLRLYAGRRLAQLKAQDVEAAQEHQLLQLVRRAKQTAFGRAHDFDTIRCVQDFQERVPLRSYEQMWDEYWKPAFPRLSDCSWPGVVPYYAVSSGTSSGTTKYLPYTSEMTASNTKAALDLLVFHLSSCPKSKIFGGRCFMLGGSTELVEQAPGIFSGDLSGIAVKTMRWWARPRYFPPPELALLKNWEEKIGILGRRSLAADIRMISGVPTWLLIFFDKLAELVPNVNGKIASFYPKLDLLVHGGVNFTPYRQRFLDLLEGSTAEMREVYPASEGYVANADLAYGEGLRMTLDHGIFFEFVPLEELSSSSPTRLWIKDVECNVEYAIVLSTCAGAWAYILGDTVKFIERRPPRVLVTGRTSYYLSAFGEHVIADEVEDAVNSAAQRIGCTINEYSVGALYPENKGELGGHLYIIEFRDPRPPPEKLDDFARQLDKRLCERNEDYDAHRAKGFGLRAPQIIPVSTGTFTKWMKERGKLGGQNKVPRIITNRDLFGDLQNFCCTSPQEEKSQPR